MNQTIKKALDAYGGQVLWRSAKAIEAEFSANGLAFSLKRRPPFNHAKAMLDISRPICRITPIGRVPSSTGILEGPHVRLEDENGEVIKERKNARQYFPGGRRILYWDDLDMAYFANYAMWNYLTLPALLLRSDIIWREISEGFLEATFPRDLPTHSQIQYFRFDLETGLLLQHDYTAKVISRFAKAAHVVLAHSQSEGLTFSSHRRVTPRSSKGKARRGPTLIEIFMHKYSVQE